MRRSCLVLAPGADRVHPMGGRHPGAPLSGPGALPRRRLAGLGTDSFRNGAPAAQAGCKVRRRASRGEPVPSRCCRAAALAGLALLVGHAQQHLQLLGGCSRRPGLCGGFQPAEHEHGQGRGGRVVGVDRGADPGRLRPDQLWPAVQQRSSRAARSAGMKPVNRMSWLRGMNWLPGRSDTSAHSLATSSGSSSPRGARAADVGPGAARRSSLGNPVTPLPLRGRPSQADRARPRPGAAAAGCQRTPAPTTAWPGREQR